VTTSVHPRKGRCIRTGLFAAVLLAAGPLCAADGDGDRDKNRDGASVGIGVDYSRGDYGGTLDTGIVSVPLSAQLRRGRWQFGASLPWLRVSGDRNVVPTLGLLPGLGFADAPGTERTTTSGIGDLDLSAAYSVDTGGKLGIDLGAKAKIATADADRGLGTGANDYGVSVDLYRDVAGTLLFGGVGHAWIGDSQRIEATTQRRANVGLAHRAGRGQLGLMYEQRSALVDQLEGRRDATAFYSLPTASGGRFKLYASHGLSDGSPDWGAGVAVSAGF
jgi:hypothetical protein